MGPFDTKSSQPPNKMGTVDEAITDTNETEPLGLRTNEKILDSSDEEDEPIREGDHKGKVQKIMRDRIRKYRRE